MSSKKNTVQPEMCYHSADFGQKVVAIRRYERGYHETNLTIPHDCDVEEFVSRLNEEIGVSKDQADAMYCGSLFGWNVPGAR